ncbi:hypothetical protein EN884_24570 [Mesorhizobium sp. M7A.F.Ca.AU.001.01.1.1]|nr:hypothetical protein EOC84_23915 [Mesorhizobium sp. Primo-B]RUX16076.1 hypothetical protein EN996_10550 [Mesorhizobium sp. M7A.F.Ca.CA.002.14.1.2]RUX58929.1 hypothetical protein EN989_15000 [Mesorhizobium sp. M7A.F.Ca.CA.002.12.1.1]RUY83893.1 hypothetical protein EN969_26315 [Mesorhizobium sp. M7A.F.Ca.CA.003.01.2.1]RUZ02781.1 hypothetical protein EN958_26810 [Mesorhizobium sp. M7A.F.Ca.CA.002.15.1.1]RUZ66049.1 hypothetical protein EN941_07850 [Mesorhizobium sp. M7A.F.Ca.CA.002.06.1.1]RVB5
MTIALAHHEAWCCTAKEPEHPGLPLGAMTALARDTGATEQQIREIISLLGFDRASILREARLLAKDSQPTRPSSLQQ